MPDRLSNIDRVLIIKGLQHDYHECCHPDLIRHEANDPTKTWSMAEIVVRARTKTMGELVTEIPLYRVRVDQNLARGGIRYVLNWDRLTRAGYSSRPVNKQGDREWYSPLPEQKTLFRSWFVNEDRQEVAVRFRDPLPAPVIQRQPPHSPQDFDPRQYDRPSPHRLGLQPSNSSPAQSSGHRAYESFGGSERESHLPYGLQGEVDIINYHSPGHYSSRHRSQEEHDEWNRVARRHHIAVTVVDQPVP